jgi:hypothetical protein
MPVAADGWDKGDMVTRQHENEVRASYFLLDQYRLDFIGD